MCNYSKTKQGQKHLTEVAHSAKRSNSGSEADHGETGESTLNILHRISKFSVVTVLGLIVAAFAAGVIVGIAGGEANYWIDLCSDDTSGRYIPDAEIRKQVCS